MKQILLVANDNNYMQCIVDRLSFEGFAVSIVSSGEEALKAYRRGEYSLVILTCFVADAEELYEVAKGIRKNSKSQIMILYNEKIFESIKNTVDEGIVDSILEYNSDEFTLSSAVHSLYEIEPLEGANIDYYNVHIDNAQMKVLNNGENVPLTIKQITLLKYLIENKGNIISTESIVFDFLLKSDVLKWALLIEDNIFTIQKSIEKNPKKPEYIKYIVGLGYLVKN